MATPKDNASGSPDPWQGFKTGRWQTEIDVQNFIQKNYTPYEGDSAFLAGPTDRTKTLWGQTLELVKEEHKKGVLDVANHVGSSITAHGPGYIDKDSEVIVGLQTDAPLKRAIFPFGGARLVKKSLEAYGFEMDPGIELIFQRYRKDHNSGVFDVYSPEIRDARRSGIITGLPDAYGRGRIIGDYRRVALYGVDRLIEDKNDQKASLDHVAMSEDVIRLREELTDQIKSLNELKQMGESYGYDIARPAITAREAVQWTYFGYLGAIKEQDGAAMSFGRTSAFMDIYFQRDFDAGVIDESAAQEIIDDLVIKLRIVRFLRPPEYNELFSGDPTWVTETVGGMGVDGRSLVTKSCFRYLQTLINLGPAPEPNLTVLWSKQMPRGFKDYCAHVSIETSSVQYEADDVMRPYWGDDYSIACCVSPMRLGKQMQFFGARVNMAKCLLYAINGGRDEKSGKQIAPAMKPITADVLDFDEVKAAYETMMDWLARTYVNTLNIIHYMHDKYAYEKIEMALHDRDVFRTMACGIAGLSVAADSLSAIKHAQVSVVRDESGLAVDYKTEGDFPHFGNNDDRVDDLAVWITTTFMAKIRQNPTYRDATHTQSILTITSNVVYGHKTGNTPDGRRDGEAFAPGANPMHGRDTHGAVASLASVAKLPYDDAQDGISNTFSIVPDSLGRSEADRIKNLTTLLDGYGDHGGQHLNVNVMNRETLLDAMEHPEEYPQLTIRVSGYAVNFVRLTREQQLDVINRTFHEGFGAAQEVQETVHGVELGRPQGLGGGE